MRQLGTLALVVGLHAITGCAGPACDDAFRPWGAVIELSTGSQTGAYQVQVSSEKKLLVVEFTIDATSGVTCVDGCADREDPVKIGPLPVTGLEQMNATRTVRLQLLRSTVPTRGPASFELRVAHDQMAVHDQLYTPTYHNAYPANEEGCDLPVANIAVDLSQL